VLSALSDRAHYHDEVLIAIIGLNLMALAVFLYGFDGTNVIIGTYGGEPVFYYVPTRLSVVVSLVVLLAGLSLLLGSRALARSPRWPKPVAVALAVLAIVVGLAVPLLVMAIYEASGLDLLLFSEALGVIVFAGPSLAGGLALAALLSSVVLAKRSKEVASALKGIAASLSLVGLLGLLSAPEAWRRRTAITAMVCLATTLVVLRGSYLSAYITEAARYLFTYSGLARAEVRARGASCGRGAWGSSLGLARRGQEIRPPHGVGLS